MRKNLISFAIFSSFVLLNMISLVAQIPEAISITPANATGWDEITIAYSPSKGCTPSGKGSLVGSNVVNMHSAAFLYDNITNWKKAWGAYGIDYNSVPKDSVHLTAGLTKTSDTTWAITMVPADYYGVPEGKVIIGLTIVFNSGNWDKEGKDFKLDACVDFYVPLTYTAPSAIKVPQGNSSSSLVVRTVSSEKLLQVECLNGIREIVIIDILGKEIIKSRGFDKNKMEVKTFGLRQGIYIVAVTEKNGKIVSAKFIKE